MKGPYFHSTFYYALLVLLLGCSMEEEVLPPPPSPAPAGGQSIVVIQDEFQHTSIVVAGSEGKGFVVSYGRQLSGGILLDFEAVQDRLPVLMRDQEGNEWDLWGKAVSGPREGSQLPLLKSGMGYWFVFGAMYPGAEIYGGQDRLVDLDQKAEDPWLIPGRYIFQGSGYDAIGSLENPPFVEYDFRNDVGESFYLKDQDRVIGVQISGVTQAYPHAILNWHEVVNDELPGASIAVVFCPLTATTTVWDRELSVGMTSFGVSGLLYNNNVLPFDRATGSIWTQLESYCVRGDLAGEQLGRYPFVEMPWKTWQHVFKNPKVLSEDTGVDRNYRNYPYGDYRTNHDFLAYPIAYDDDRLPRKERVHGVIIDGEAKVYRMKDF